MQRCNPAARMCDDVVADRRALTPTRNATLRRGEAPHALLRRGFDGAGACADARNARPETNYSWSGGPHRSAGKDASNFEVSHECGGSPPSRIASSIELAG